MVASPRHDGRACAPPPCTLRTRILSVVRSALEAPTDENLNGILKMNLGALTIKLRNTIKAVEVK